jgi:hypothetical protein
MSSGSVDRNDPESGWRVDVVPSFLPAQMLGGEHRLAVFGAIPTAFIVFCVASRVGGSLGPIPMPLVVVAACGVFYLAWLALIRRMWTIDPWLSHTVSRFLRHPLSFPAHSSIAVSAARRRLILSKGFKRT